MTAPSSLLGDRQDLIPGAGYGAPDEQEIALGVHPHDSKASLSVPASNHVARHPFALDDSRRIGARADGARLAVTRVTMGSGAASGAITVHQALEPAAFRLAGDFDHLSGCED